MGCPLHLGEVEAFVDYRFDSCYDNRHVVGFATCHDRGNRNHLHGCHPTARPHLAEYEIGVQPGGERHTIDAFRGRDDYG